MAYELGEGINVTEKLGADWKPGRDGAGRPRTPIPAFDDKIEGWVDQGWQYHAMPSKEAADAASADLKKAVDHKGRGVHRRVHRSAQVAEMLGVDPDTWLLGFEVTAAKDTRKPRKDKPNPDNGSVSAELQDANTSE